MANKKPRTITISDEVFEGLRKIGQFNRYNGDKTLVNPSALLEHLGQKYIDENKLIVNMIEDNEKQMEQKARNFQKPK